MPVRPLVTMAKLVPFISTQLPPEHSCTQRKLALTYQLWQRKAQSLPCVAALANWHGLYWMSFMYWHLCLPRFIISKLGLLSSCWKGSFKRWLKENDGVSIICPSQCGVPTFHFYPVQKFYFNLSAVFVSIWCRLLQICSTHRDNKRSWYHCFVLQLQQKTRWAGVKTYYNDSKSKR